MRQFVYWTSSTRYPVLSYLKWTKPALKHCKLAKCCNRDCGCFYGGYGTSKKAASGKLVLLQCFWVHGDVCSLEGPDLHEKDDVSMFMLLLKRHSTKKVIIPNILILTLQLWLFDFPWRTGVFRCLKIGNLNLCWKLSFWFSAAAPRVFWKLVLVAIYLSCIGLVHVFLYLGWNRNIFVSQDII